MYVATCYSGIPGRPDGRATPLPRCARSGSEPVFCRVSLPAYEAKRF